MLVKLLILLAFLLLVIIIIVAVREQGNEALSLCEKTKGAFGC